MLPGRCLKFCLLAALLAVGGSPYVAGQTGAPQYDSDDPGGVFTPRDRRLQSLLEQSQRQLSTTDGDDREALASLQRIIDDAEDVFTDSTMKVSLREEAARIIAASSDRTRQHYEETFGAEAASLLGSADSGSRQGRLAVIRRFFHTKAGADAAFQVAATEMDNGHFLTAARLLDRLRTEHRGASRFEPELSQRCVICYWRSGETERAATVLEEAALGLDSFRMSGEAVPELTSTDAAAKWLAEHLTEPRIRSSLADADWKTPHGANSRNATVAPVSPLYDDAWSVPLIRDRDADDPVQVEELRTVLAGLTTTVRDAGWPMIPAMTPLVVGKTVVFPSYGLVKAVDIHDGTLRWVALPADHTFVDALSSSSGTRSRPLSSDINDFLVQRAWRDVTSSQISSDGERIYCVRDSGMVGGLPPQFAERAQMNHPRLPRAFNALRAYDAFGGNWKWEVGGARTRTALPLAGTFFLGAPLAVDGTLYVLGEDLGQVRLHALAPETGDVLWSVPLANGDVDIEEDLDRRLAGLSPTLAGGLLICPTGGGLIVAVDPLTRTLKWGMRYRDPQTAASPQRFGRGAFIGFQSTRAQQATLEELMAEPRWHDACIIAAGSSLLVTPPDVADFGDNRRLLCLNLLDGTTRWQRPRSESLYIGGVYGGTVLLIGERQAEGVNLQHGRTLWTIPLDEPSGRGVRSGKLFHLPLLQGAIATIDVAEGKLLAVSPVRSEETLGNLIAVDGRLISQSASEVRSFRPRGAVVEEIARELETDPEKAEALAARGELRLHSGETEAGLADLRKAVADSDDERSRQLLVTTLLEGLRADFAAYRSSVAEIDRLATTPELRSGFLMTYAQGLLDAGETTLAFEQYIRLLTEGDAGTTMDYTEDGRRVRRDRRVQGRLAHLYGNATPEQRAELDVVIDKRLADDASTGDPTLTAAMAAAIPRLRHHDGADPSVVDTVDVGLSPTQLEGRLLAARRTASAEVQAAVTARLVELYTQHGRVESAVQLLGELETVWAETPCLDDKTGAEWAAAMRETEGMADLLSKAVHWPTAQIEVKEDIGNTGPFTPLRTEGPTDPSATFLFLPDNQGRIAIQDGYGRPVPQGVLTMLPAGGASFQSQYVMQRGHRAVLFQGTQFKLLDLMDGTPRVLLEELLVNVNPADGIGLRMRQRQVRRQLGFRGVVLWSDDPDENGSVGPLNDSLFCYLRGNTLTAHDPFTGSPYWSVTDAPHGAEIFADADYVFLVPVGQNVAHVYRALDGEKLGVRTLPPDVVRDRRGADWGRYLLRQTGEGSEARLAMYDPVTEQNVWERATPEAYHWAPRDGSDLVVVDQNGKLVVLDPESGDVRQEAEVTVPQDVMSVSVLNLPDQWVLFTYRRPAADADAQIFQPQMTQTAYAVNGPATAFMRHTGEIAWSRDVATQMVMPGLPSRWPILSLSAIVQELPKAAGPRVPMLTRRVELINRLTGETVHEAVTDGNSRQLDSFWRVSDAEPQLRLRYGLLELEVFFRSEAPAETEPNEDADADADEPS